MRNMLVTGRSFAAEHNSTSIYMIDMTNLPTDTYLFDVDSLKARLGFVHPTSTHEFLFLHRITSEAIVGKKDLGGIWEEGM